MTTEARVHPVDDSTILWNVPESARAGQPLLVMMHGRGSHEGDLFGLGRFMPNGMVIASLRAPLRYGGGYEWFSGGGHGDDAESSLNASVRGVLAWLDTLALTPSSIGLMGFSQGGRMALQLLRHAPSRFRYAVQLSGAVAMGDHPGDAALVRLEPGVPVFWGHGDLDQMIDSASIDWTREWLQGHVAAEEHRYSMAHTICQEELADMAAFVALHH